MKYLDNILYVLLPIMFLSISNAYSTHSNNFNKIDKERNNNKKTQCIVEVTLEKMK